MAEFWFIRHFRTPWNAEGRLQGQRDIALDDQDMATLAVNRLTLGETFADFTARIMRIRQRVLAAPGSVLAFGHGAWLGGLRLMLEPPARISSVRSSIPRRALRREPLSAIGPRTMASAPFRTAVPARVPFAFCLDLDACAVDQRVQRANGAATGDVDGEDFRRQLSVLKSGTVHSSPIRCGRLSTNPPIRRKHFHPQAGLDRSITATALPSALAGRRRPDHLRIVREP